MKKLMLIFTLVLLVAVCATEVQAKTPYLSQAHAHRVVHRYIERDVQNGDAVSGYIESCERVSRRVIDCWVWEYAVSAEGIVPGDQDGSFGFAVRVRQGRGKLAYGW